MENCFSTRVDSIVQKTLWHYSRKKHSFIYFIIHFSVSNIKYVNFIRLYTANVSLLIYLDTCTISEKVERYPVIQQLLSIHLRSLFLFDYCRTRSGVGQPRARANLGTAFERRVLERHWGNDPLFSPRQPLAANRLVDGRRFTGITDTTYPWDVGERFHVLPAVRCRELSTRRTLGDLSVPSLEQRRQGARPWNHGESR